MCQETVHKPSSWVRLQLLVEFPTSGLLAQEAGGHEVSDEAKAHLSFAHFEAINPYGTMVFDIAGVLKRSRRPLRRP